MNKQQSAQAYTIDKIYQIRVDLKSVSPKVWRRLQIRSSTLFGDFHKILQTAMGWYNIHTHHFIKDKTIYAPDSLEIPLPRKLSYELIRINSVIPREKEKISYIYNLREQWIHEITLEKILSLKEDVFYPLCTDGEGACPPEDSGGPIGYAHIIEVMKNPNSTEYKNIKEWLGDEEFDPQKFNIEAVSRMLKSKDFGCNTLYQ